MKRNIKKIVIWILLSFILFIPAKKGMKIVDPRSLTMEYDNEISIEECITVETSAYAIKYLQKAIEAAYSGYRPKITVASFFKQFNFNIECTRKTPYGYYFVLRQNDGKLAYIFINEKLELKDVKVFDKFLSKEDFDFIVFWETINCEVYEIDPNKIFYSISAAHFSGHILQDGYLVVHYNFDYESIINKTAEGETLFAESIKFYSEEDLIANIDDWDHTNGHYILPMDRSNRLFNLKSDTGSKER